MNELTRRDLQLQNMKPSFSQLLNSSTSSSSSNLMEITNHKTLLFDNFITSSNIHNHNNINIPTEFSNPNLQLPFNFASLHNIQSFFTSSSPPVVSGTSTSQNLKSYGGRKRKRKEEQQEMEKPKDVIHVRAKRGQATDSHSLAERVRREKINEKLRCLQDMVPGCYKTMGMAVMLDVIINYVQSLQNQIEFLSMKLSAASMYHDFNMERDAMETMHGASTYEVQEMMKMEREGYGGTYNYFNPTWPF